MENDLPEFEDWLYDSGRKLDREEEELTERAELGYSKSRNALAVHVDKEDQADALIQGLSQKRRMTIINESGLMRWFSPPTAKRSLRALPST